MTFSLPLPAEISGTCHYACFLKSEFTTRHSVEGGLSPLSNQYRGSLRELSNQKRRLMERQLLTRDLSSCPAVTVTLSVR